MYHVLKVEKVEADCSNFTDRNELTWGRRQFISGQALELTFKLSI
jgi:hypothetical protein